MGTGFQKIPMQKIGFIPINIAQNRAASNKKALVVQKLVLNLLKFLGDSGNSQRQQNE
jgi:hypothetical protein